jgi:hypothetical protein
MDRIPVGALFITPAVSLPRDSCTRPTARGRDESRTYNSVASKREFTEIFIKIYLPPERSARKMLND